MNQLMLTVAPDVLVALLALRQSEQESLDEVIRRVLADNHGCQRDVAVQAPHTPRVTAPGAFGVRYTLSGDEYGAMDAAHALTSILLALSKGNPCFFEILATKVRGRTRNHLARSTSQVYPNRPDLMHHVKEIVPGWFLGYNLANREKEKIPLCQQ